MYGAQLCSEPLGSSIVTRSMHTPSVNAHSPAVVSQVAPDAQLALLAQLVEQSVCSSLQAKGAQFLWAPSTQLPVLLHTWDCVTPDAQIDSPQEVESSGKEQPSRVSPSH